MAENTETVPVDMDRDEIKKELEERGISFRANARTEILATMLEEVMANDEPEEETQEEQSVPGESNPEPEPEEEEEQEEPEEKTAAPEIIVSSSSRTVLIANHHTAPIALPRKAQGNVSLPAITLPPGRTTPLEGSAWDEYKQQKTVQAYMDHHLLSEVSTEGDVPVTKTTSTNPVIPEHLQSEEEQGSVAPSTASVTKQNPGSVTV